MFLMFRKAKHSVLFLIYAHLHITHKCASVQQNIFIDFNHRHAATHGLSALKLVIVDDLAYVI